MTNAEERLNAVRTWIAEDDARRERETALPRATCASCGGIAKAGEGTRDLPQPKGPRPTPANPELIVMVDAPAAPAHADDWRRTCGTCVGATSAEIVGRVIGWEPEEADAHEVLSRMREVDSFGFVTTRFPFASTAVRATRRPWGHVTRADRDRVRRVLAEVVRDRTAGPCTQGACGVCGIRVSLRWFEGPPSLRWSEGSPAPVCQACQAVFDRRPEALTVEQVRKIAVEAATGLASMGDTVPPEFRCYFETKDCDGNGNELPWDYGQGIREFIRDTWTDRPHLAPEGLRNIYRERAAERRARWQEAHEREEAAKHASAW
ncbi:hypothetical protein G3H63_10860 [Microbacterium resistens]|uniref:hypothetical protein n=1 Tax=Microbacterium resistens TaxID=156977 RepID=UPI001C5A3B86|nr:hypothetical protein [Microbacterium resistens]MBW1639566.1 hypothetical protein [Microbacterium resistens]